MNNGNGKSKTLIAAIILGSLALLLSLTFFVLKVVVKVGDEDVEVGEVESIEDQVEEIPEDDMEEIADEEVEEIPDNEEVEEIPDTEVVDEEVVEEKLALKYVPKPGLKLKFANNYPDGTKGETEDYTAKIEDGILVSKATMLPYEVDTLSIYHFVEGQEGIYLVQNDNPEDNILWLPNNPKEGDVWKGDYTEYKILEVGATIEAGGKKYENCIVRKNINELVEFTDISYIAPGYGEVYSVYKDGSMEFELIEEETDDFEIANDLMKDKIKFLDMILKYRDK